MPIKISDNGFTTQHGDLQLAMRLKTARAVDEMIAALERHRNDV